MKNLKFTNITVCVQLRHKIEYYELIFHYSMDKKESSLEKNTQEFYLLEKLYNTIEEDRKRPKPDSKGRELYLVEKLYDTMLNEKSKKTSSE